MSLGKDVQRLIHQSTGLHVFRQVPRGLDLIADVKAAFPPFRPKVIFDVGANTGQSAEKLLHWDPQATIYSFEPMAATFQQLKQNVARYPRVQCFPLAFGATQGTVVMQEAELSVMARLSTEAEPTATGANTITMDTVVHFAQTQGIDRISLLKIDTEGHDLEVLKGAEPLLAAQKIDFIQVEAGMNPRNTWHVPMAAFLTFLEPFDYALFGIYEQVFEWPTGEPQLRRADLVFIPLPKKGIDN